MSNQLFSNWVIVGMMILVLVAIIYVDDLHGKSSSYNITNSTMFSIDIDLPEIIPFASEEPKEETTRQDVVDTINKNTQNEVPFFKSFKEEITWFSNQSNTCDDCQAESDLINKDFTCDPLIILYKDNPDFGLKSSLTKAILEVCEL